MNQNIEFLTADDFIEPSNKNSVFHGFFTRKGGVSKGVFEGLNCGLGSADIKENIAKNRCSVAQKAGISPKSLLSVYQVHGSKVITVKKLWSEKERPHADAHVSDEPGIGLSILTADCAPVLFVGYKENKNPVIGAAHAGWQGALGGVIENTLDAMKKLGAEKESLRACVGPCIAQASYEVTNDFILPFKKEDRKAERFFMPGQKDGHAYFDLSGYCAWRLARYGIKYMSLVDMDTYTNEEKFFSYRRTTHRKEQEYGRQTSVISIL